MDWSGCGQAIQALGKLSVPIDVCPFPLTFLIIQFDLFQLQVSNNNSINSSMSEKEELLKTAMQEVDLISTKQRFGYFSMPANLSIGDFPDKKTRNVDADGKVTTAPRNIYTKPSQSGNSKSSYFGLAKSIYDGDLYMDPGKHDQVQALKKSKLFDEKDKFRPLNSVHKTLLGSSYVHIDENPVKKDPKAKRDQDGKVMSLPRNIQTGPQSKVATELFKHPQFMANPYDAQRRQRAEQHKLSKSQMSDQAFKNTCFQKQYFSDPKQVYGTDVQFKEKILKESNFNIMSHDSQFKTSGPCASGQLGFIGKFPEHIPNPPTQVKRKFDQVKKTPFKLSAPNKIVTPSPSISFSSGNLRKYCR